MLSRTVTAQWEVLAGNSFGTPCLVDADDGDDDGDGGDDGGGDDDGDDGSGVDDAEDGDGDGDDGVITGIKRDDKSSYAATLTVVIILAVS